jgi:hypothetical protein
MSPQIARMPPHCRCASTAAIIMQALMEAWINGCAPPISAKSALIEHHVRHKCELSKAKNSVLSSECIHLSCTFQAYNFNYVNLFEHIIKNKTNTAKII